MTNRTWRSFSEEARRDRVSIGRFVRGAVWLLAGVSAFARAETIWMQPERGEMTPGATLILELARGEQLGVGSAPIDGAAVREVIGRLAGAPVMITAAAAGLPAKVAVTLPSPGIGVLVAELRPQANTVAVADVPRYLRRLYAGNDVLAAWRGNGAPAPWTERRSMRLKAFVRVGEPPATDRAWSVPEPAGLDIVPERDPTQLLRNIPFTVRVLQAGKPAAGIVVSFVSFGETRENVVVSDSAGRATAELDAPGRWLIQAVLLKQRSGTDRTWELEIAGMTIETR